jgi:hypothetical protein
MNTITYRGVVYDSRHGGPFDRGSADSYYHRACRPHFYTGATYSTQEIIPEKGSPEYLAYKAGYEYNEELGDKKEWD